MAGNGITEQEVKDQEKLDGTPARVQLFRSDTYGGGDSREPLLDIKFQLGPHKDVGINGVAVEDVIGVLIRRLQGFQVSGFASRENALTITKLEEAKHWLMHLTMKRKAQGVEGHSIKHKP